MAQRFGIDFFLTKTCNKHCYYCTSFTSEERNLEVNLDFLTFVLSELSKYGSKNFVIRLLGGETALIKNLNEVIEICRKYKLQGIQVYSNSLIRERYPWILEDKNISYFEHLFYKIQNGKIVKLSNYDFLPENNQYNYNIVVLTNNFITEYTKIDINPLLHKNTIWKMVNDRSKVDIIDSYEDKYMEFKQMIQSYGLDVGSSSWSKNKLTKENKLLCSLNPPSPVINFEDKTIHHCSKTPDFTQKIECTSENISKLVKSSLFIDFPEYCERCKEPSLNNRIQNIIKCKKNIPTN